MKAIKLIGMILAGIILFVVAVSLKEGGTFVFGATPPPIEEWGWNFKSVITAMIYYILTLLGIISGIIFESLNQLEETKRIRFKHIKKYLTTVRSWKGLIASPLIFLSVYIGVGKSGLSLPLLLLAYQNGFFWKSIMSALEKKTNIEGN